MIVSLRLGLWEFGRDFDTAAPPHDTTAQTLAPNKSLLCRLGLQMTSFSQDDSRHTVNVLASLFYGPSFLQSMVCSVSWNVHFKTQHANHLPKFVMRTIYKSVVNKAETLRPPSGFLPNTKKTIYIN